MANYSMADIKALREKTGAGMMDVKKALEEAEGDADKALEIIRVKGLKGVSKREGRSASDGLVAAEVVTAGDGEDEVGVIVEVNSETDFVAKNATFITLSEKVLATAVASGARVAGEKVSVYLHKVNKDLPPQVGVLVATDAKGAEVARDIATHIAAFSPAYLTRDEVPAETVENERRIAEETARNEGKPEAALPKIVEGRLTGYFKDVVLLDQPFAKDSKKSVAQVLAEVGGTVTGFVRFRVGA